MQAPAEPEADLSTTITDYSEVVLPLDAYLESNEALVLDGQAQSLLIRDCMARHGLDWPISPATEVTEPQHHGRHGILDPDEVQQYGYHPLPEALDAEVPEPPLSEAHEQHLETCAGEAQAILREGLPADDHERGTPTLAQELAAEASTRAEGDSRVRAAWDAWSDCMAEYGYDYQGPWDAINDQRWWQGRGPSDAEIAAATADLDCRQRTNLVGIWFAVESAYQQQLIEQHADALAAIRARLDARARNVAAVLAAYGANPA
ncbi:MAG TPA: hypothetical protein VK028_02860 [Micromonosporaceae bacterium]|nr:hypothetical protein [Micromonosporaceae bacterium]